MAKLDMGNSDCCFVKRMKTQHLNCLSKSDNTLQYLNGTVDMNYVSEEWKPQLNSDV